MKQIDLNKILNITQLSWTGLASASSDGILPKCVLNQGGTLTYLKLGAYQLGYGFYGIEPVMELVFSRVGQLMGFNVLPYDLVRAAVSLDGVTYDTVVSVSKDFKVAGELSISAEKAYMLFRTPGETPLATFSRITSRRSLYMMFLFDFLICNMDRHGKNVEFLSKTGNTGSLTMAPLFDNSLSFMGVKTEQEVSTHPLFNEHCAVNNFIGDRNLLSNIKRIDIPLKVRALRPSDRTLLFQGLGKILSRQRRDFIWNTLIRRQEYVRREVRSIQWR